MNKKIALFGLLILLVFQLFAFSGCWDRRGLDELYIVTGIAIDKSDDPENSLEVTLQIAKTEADPTGTRQGGSITPINVSKKSNSLDTAISEMNRDNSRNILLDHNQVLIVGEDLAKEGIKQHLDFFIRLQESRIEVPLIIVEGKAKDVLEAETLQDSMSSLHVARKLDSLQQFSKHSRVRIFDMMRLLMCANFGGSITMVKLSEEDEEGKKEIMVTGMAVFRDGIMTGKLDGETTTGYLYLKDKLIRQEIEVENEEGRVVFQVNQAKPVNKLAVNPDLSVKSEYKLEGTAEIAELTGFIDVKPTDLIDHLTILLNDAIAKQINSAITLAKQLETDIFGTAEKLCRFHHSDWKLIIDNWTQTFLAAEFEVTSTLAIVGTGDIAQSVEIEQILKKEKMLNG